MKMKNRHEHDDVRNATRAALKLFPKPPTRRALCKLSNTANGIVDLLKKLMADLMRSYEDVSKLSHAIHLPPGGLGRLEELSRCERHGVFDEHRLAWAGNPCAK